MKYIYKGIANGNVKYFKAHVDLSLNRGNVEVYDIKRGVFTVVNADSWNLQKVDHFRFDPVGSEKKQVVDIVWSQALNNYIVVTNDPILPNHPLVLDGDFTGRHEYVRTIDPNVHLYNRVMINGRAHVKQTVNNLHRLPDCVRGVENIVVGNVYREVYGNEAMRGAVSDPFVVTGVGVNGFTYTHVKPFPSGGYYKSQMNFKDLGIIPVRIDPDGVEVYNCNGLLPV